MSVDTGDVDLVGDEVVLNVARAALMAALTGAFAYISFPIPFSTVPFSMQVLGIFLAGLLLGPVWGGISIAFYLLAGAVGAPVFQGGAAGIGHLFGSTAGYLWSYLFAAIVIGFIAHGGLEVKPAQKLPVPRIVTGLLVGTVVIYGLGVLGLILIANLGPMAALTAGALVFIPGELLKIAAAVAIVRSDRLVAA
ncbi:MULTISPECIES: biotin transporter BioY [unclassified Haladaptatus]|uniref:biotin transporter BioY n=1 Tax=unclassified Haladaptatus TaxID=2622732 RepID=UPI0023E7D454|nr:MULTISPECIES: biotin transporter BioY [unclassified Haladaptatus]